MKKILLITTIIASLAILTACSNSEAAALPADENNGQSTETMGTNQNGGEGGASAQMQGNSVVGLVSSVVGNEVTIQVGEMQGGMGASAQMPDGAEMPEDGERGEMSEDMREQFQNGEMPDDFEMPEGTARGEMSEDMRGQFQNGEMPDDFEMPEGATGERQQGGMAQGGMASMSEQDYSEIITLTDEERTFNVPITTPVTQFATEMTFSQITEDMYISVMLDESDNIVSINILG